MNRLRAELRRLYAAGPAGGDEPLAPDGLQAASTDLMGGVPLIGPADEVRALVVEVVSPAGWSEIGPLWQGVQTELEWPPPAIAVSGVDGLQLWFSLDRPVPVRQAHEILAALAGHFLPAVRHRRLRLWPVRDGTVPREGRHARWVPARQGGSGNWSAFVAADLAPIFAETPWLDLPPGEEGQLNLLRGLRSVPAPTLEAARQRLPPVVVERPSAASSPSAADRPSTAPVPPAGPPASLVPASPGPEPSAAVFEAAGSAADDPACFLRRVMNDDGVPLALRIEAARALLPR